MLLKEILKTTKAFKKLNFQRNQKAFRNFNASRTKAGKTNENPVLKRKSLWFTGFVC